MKKYYEKKLLIQRKHAAFETAAYICSGEKEPCYLYEHHEGISIGAGICMEVIATPEELVVQQEGAKQSIKIVDLCQDLERVFKSLDIACWRAYGIANFGLARYIHGLDKGAEAKEFLHFVIPNKEYRVLEDAILLRALNKEDINMMENNVSDAVQGGRKDDIATVYDQRDVLAFDEEYYKGIVRLAVKDIGDKRYQKVILSRKIPVKKRLDMLQTYLHGRGRNTPARSYYYRFPNLEVAGFSPETIAEINDAGIVYTFPLAGTRALTGDAHANEHLKEELQHDPKEIAEHAISVKLADEEMKQVCAAGSVAVTEFMSVIERGTVQHLGSRLRGSLKEGCNSWHAFCKLFPAVTASGIPKKAAIEAIGRLEKHPRHLYSGGVLIYDCNGALDAALVLRSVFQNAKESWVRAGAGIVGLSNPQREFKETEEKIRSVAEQLIIEH